MKKNIFLTASIFLIIGKAFASPVIQNIKSNGAARATFDSIWVDYDVTENGIRGMKVHVGFTVYEMKDSTAYVAIFFNDDLGDRLEDNNNKFASSGGDVALYEDIKPQYDPAVYKDFSLFMPYDELDLDPGNYNLSMEVNLIYPNGNLIQHLTDFEFQYNKPENSSQPATTANASLEKMWVDYDITKDGQKGMLIHTKFSMYNLKDVACYLAIYFEKTGGDPLKTENKGYRAKSGQVAIFFELHPGYNPITVYNDVQLFMPYNELNLGAGKFNLTMDANVIYENGDLIKNLRFYDFTFQQ